MTRLRVDEYVSGVLEGDRARLAQTLTLIESERVDDRVLAARVLRALLPSAGRSRRIGVTGAPGAGKSTFIDRVGGDWASSGCRVAVLAVDPTSERTGGSILGDKTRMTRLSSVDNAYVRPTPSRGALGGVGQRTRDSITVCEAAGFDMVLVETVGVGQSESMVADMVDCFVLLLLPNAGDELQGIKRGVLELADLLVVNKADGDQVDAARRTVAQYTHSVGNLAPRWSGWRTEVIEASAQNGAGCEDFRARINAFYEQVQGELSDRRSRQSVRWMWRIAQHEIASRLRAHPEVAANVDALETEVRDGRVGPTEAALKILDLLGW